MCYAATQSGALRRGAYRDLHPYPTHPSTAFKPVYTKAFKRFDYKFKIGAMENTFAGHWETVVLVDCMENIGKGQLKMIQTAKKK